MQVTDISGAGWRATHAAMATLRDAGVIVEHVERDHLKVADRFEFFVASKFWRAADESARGYGLRSLIVAARSS